ncbi:hypothetical protein BST61_g117 [Cercospora zeina]
MSKALDLEEEPQLFWTMYADPIAPPKACHASADMIANAVRGIALSVKKHEAIGGKAAMQFLYLTAGMAAMVLSVAAAPVAPQAYSRPTNLIAAESSAQAYGNERFLRIVDARDAGAKAAQAYGNEKALRVVDQRDAGAEAAQAYGNEKALRVVEARDAGAKAAQAYGNEKALRVVDQRDAGAEAAQAYGNEKALRVVDNA